MPYEKQKSENYTNLGGINTKVSQYITGPTEFLSLINVDFRSAGALSSFCGSTLRSTTFLSGGINSLVEFNLFSSSQPYLYSSPSFLIMANGINNLWNATSGFTSVYNYLSTNDTNPWTYSKAGNYLFAANGNNVITYPGYTTAWQFSLPKMFFTRGAANTGSNTNTPGLSGNLFMQFSLVRSDGLVGPAVGYTIGPLTGQTQVVFEVPQFPFLNGWSIGSFGVLTPGASAVQMWATLNNQGPFAYTALVGVSQISFAINFNWTASGWNSLTPEPLDYQGAFLYGFGESQGSTGSNVYIPTGQIPLAIPSILEYFQNQLFTAGFQSRGSFVNYSNIGTPEQSDYTNNFEVNSEDNDSVSCMKSYFTQLMIFKSRSTWMLNGTDSSNFVLSQVSPIYGCLSSRAACVWNQKIWFLDSKGICEFNGANVEVVSNKVESIFSRMNISAAVSQAVMIHVKERNEVWCCVPIDGASQNNIVIVYDYLTNAWTTRQAGLNIITAIAPMYLGYNKESILFASTDNALHSFGNSYVTDLFLFDPGSGYTALSSSPLQVIKTRFLEDMGNSVTKQFRRLYLDASVPSGASFVILVNLYADKQTTAALNTTMVLSSSYQNRIDFGIPAKSLSAELIYAVASATSPPFILNGFTIEYRFQRAT